ncbi:MAG TPA: TRAP transporter small permease [Burkholderiales bacterium]|nr:TRAP transporter small permease [Burkholderiales bacterium]
MSGHGPAAVAPAAGSGGILGAATALLHKVNGMAAVVSAIAVGTAGCVLTWEATARYLFKIPSDWQDELSIFLLVGATFLSAAWVQEWRGHVGIQALAAILPPRADRIRRFLSDVASLVFCTFFSWKSWSLLIEAVHDGQTSNSAWGAPLWVPYGCMALGMSLVALQLLVQVLSRETLRHRA